MWSGTTWISLFWNTRKHCSRFEHNKSVQTMSLTSVCCVHSNVYGLGNVHWIRYLTVVDPLLSTSSTLQSYLHLTSGYVEISLITSAGNCSSTGKVPVSFGRPIITSIRRPATSSEVSHTEQGIITFTNVLQGHTTVVLVCYISEGEPDITCTRKFEYSPHQLMYHTYSQIPQVVHACS